MSSTTTLAIIIVILVAPWTAHAQCTKDADCNQERVCVNGKCYFVEDTKPQFVCSIVGRDSMPGNFALGPINKDLVQVLSELGTVIPVDMPSVRPGPVQTAKAMRLLGEPQIVVNPLFVETLMAEHGKWGVRFVLAHELGHYVHGDVWHDVGESQKKQELAADRFAVRTLVRLGAPKEATVSSFDALPSEETQTHPSTTIRKEKAAAVYDEEARKNCPEGKEYNGISCVDRCPRAEEYKAGKCVRRCGEDFQWTTGGCVPLCSNPTTKWDVQSNRCIERCEEGWRWVETSCVERCSPEQRWDSHARRCEARCEESEHWNGSRCVERCDSDKSWNTSTKKCVNRCSSGERWNGAECEDICNQSERWNAVQRKCISRCRAHEEWDELAERCISTCLQPKQLINGRCGYPPGWGMLQCGCHGYIQLGVSQPDSHCASGYSVASACPFACPMGGYAWGVVCR